jgi:hypothetical protein
MPGRNQFMIDEKLASSGIDKWADMTFHANRGAPQKIRRVPLSSLFAARFVPGNGVPTMRRVLLRLRAVARLTTPR